MGKYLFSLLFVLASDAYASPVSHFPQSGLTHELYEHLDLKSFRSSLGPKRNNIHTLKDFVEFDCPNAKITFHQTFFEVECPHLWYYKIEVLSRGDFNNDQVEDLELKKEDRALQGSYNTTSIVTVTRKNRSGAIVFAGLEKEKELAR